MSHRIASVEPDPERFRLTIRWHNGAVTVRDLRRDVARREIFAALREPRVFGRVRVLDRGYAVGWPGTDVDFAADALWYQAHPGEQPFPDEVMTAADFTRWLHERGYSLSTAAAALGLSRRAVAYYASGARRIPRVVFLACMALACGRRTARAAA
jgi:hypothetical protein